MVLWNSKQNQQRENIFKINQWRYKWCIHFTFDNNLEIAVLSCPETILVDVLILTTSQHNKMLSICWYLCNSFRFGLWTNTFNAYEFFYFVVVFITQKKIENDSSIRQVPISTLFISVVNFCSSIFCFQVRNYLLHMTRPEWSMRKSFKQKNSLSICIHRESVA